MSYGLEYAPASAIGTVRRLIGDRGSEYHFSDAELTEFLNEANSCKYGAAGLALMAWYAELTREYATVSVGNLSRSVNDLSHMRAQAERYIKMSNEVSLEANADAALATARADYNTHLSTRRETLRTFAEDTEG